MSPGRASRLTIAGDVLRAVERDHLAVAARAHALHQRIAVGAGDRLLARRIDMRDHHGVGVVEAGAELLEQRPRAANSDAAA